MPFYGTMVPSDNTGPFTLRNKIINGNMMYWQRGTSTSTATKFAADRWYLNSNNSSSAYNSDVPTGFVWSNLLTGTNALNAQITQRIEGLWLYDLVAQPIVISFWAKSTSGTSQLGVYCNYATAADNFTSTTPVGSSAFTLTSTWTRYSFVVTNSAPSSITNGLQVGLYRAGTESSATYITGVQLERGTVATPFEHRGPLEFTLCHRYFQWNTRCVGFGRDSTSFTINHHAMALFRATPSTTMGTLTPYVEDYPWSSIGSVTGAVAANGHMTDRGGDILITCSTASPSFSRNGVVEFGGSQIAIESEL